MIDETYVKRIVIWFSYGVTSAVAGKLTLDQYKDRFPIHLVCCDTGSEDEDNIRFGHDVANWLGIPLEIIRNENYTDTFDVYDSSRFFKNKSGAKCSTELKKKPRLAYQKRGDLQVFGFDTDEKARARRFKKNNPEVLPWFPLISAGITKSDARQILMAAGIVEPRTYAEGFNNANCLARGCVKGGMGYWNQIRKVRPEIFERMALKERELGYSLLVKETYPNGRRVQTPIYLDELDPNDGDYKSEPAIKCGLFCGEI